MTTSVFKHMPYPETTALHFLPPEIVKYLVQGSKGRMMHVTFMKRSTMQLRAMTCRTGVRKWVKGAAGKGRTYDPKDYSLIMVADMDKLEYRAIPAESITEIRINGERVRAVDYWRGARAARKAVTLFSRYVA